VDQVNYTAQKAWKTLHFVMHVLKKRNRKTKSSAYMSLEHPVLEYGAVCWDPCREGKINVLDHVQTKASPFTNHTEDSDWETLAQHMKIACLCALLEHTLGNRHGKLYATVCEGLKQRTDIRKYSFVNRTIKKWNQLPAEASRTFRCKPRTFRKGARKVINVVKGKK